MPSAASWAVPRWPTIAASASRKSGSETSVANAGTASRAISRSWPRSSRASSPAAAPAAIGSARHETPPTRRRLSLLHIGDISFSQVNSGSAGSALAESVHRCIPRLCTSSRGLIHMLMAAAPQGVLTTHFRVSRRPRNVTSGRVVPIPPPRLGGPVLSVAAPSIADVRDPRVLVEEPCEHRRVPWSDRRPRRRLRVRRRSGPGAAAGRGRRAVGPRRDAPQQGRHRRRRRGRPRLRLLPARLTS